MMTYKKLPIFILSSFLILTIVFGLPISRNESIDPASAQSSAELDAINKKIKELQAQRDSLNNQIKKEQNNQASLAQQARNVENALKQNELQVQSLELELQKIRLEVDFLTQELTKLESRLKEIEGLLGENQHSLEVSINLLYKLSLSSKTFLDEDSSFQQTVLDEEKEKATMRFIKASIEEIRTLQNEVLVKRDEIAKKQKEASDLQAQMEAQSANLNLQRQALEWQRINKQNLLNQSKQNQNDLSDKKAEADEGLKAIEAQKAQIISALTKLPPSDTIVNAGQVIGFQGRTGLVCSAYDSKLVPTPTNNYCGIHSGYYYYDPAQFPTKGSHLHFAYSVNGVVSNSYAYIYGDKRDQISAMPMNPMTMTQGLHGGAIDLSSSYGAPVMAVRRGKIRYACDKNYPFANFPDPAFGAFVHHVDANGNLDGTVSVYWHLQRRGYPC
jgi:hypothetical protein